MVRPSQPPDVVPQICAGASDEVLISGGYDQAVKVGSSLLTSECATSIDTCEVPLQLSHYMHCLDFHSLHSQHG